MDDEWQPTLPTEGTIPRPPSAEDIWWTGTCRECGQVAVVVRENLGLDGAQKAAKQVSFNDAFVVARITSSTAPTKGQKCSSPSHQEAVLP